MLSQCVPPSIMHCSIFEQIKWLKNSAELKGLLELRSSVITKIINFLTLPRTMWNYSPHYYISGKDRTQNETGVI